MSHPVFDAIFDAVSIVFISIIGLFIVALSAFRMSVMVIKTALKEYEADKAKLSSHTHTKEGQ